MRLKVRTCPLNKQHRTQKESHSTRNVLSLKKRWNIPGVVDYRFHALEFVVASQVYVCSRARWVLAASESRMNNQVPGSSGLRWMQSYRNVRPLPAVELQDSADKNSLEPTLCGEPLKLMC